MLYGNGSYDRLYGGSGNDLLDGGLSADLMDGGSGDDHYIVDDAGDSIVELADAGFDTVTASVSHELAENVEKLILVGDANASALGNSLDNEILGDDSDNHLSGSGGDDIIRGGGEMTSFLAALETTKQYLKVLSLTI